MRLSLRPSPDLFDLEAWKERLKDLEVDPEDTVGRDAAIDHAKTMIDLLDDTSDKMAAQAS